VKVHTSADPSGIFTTGVWEPQSIHDEKGVVSKTDGDQSLVGGGWT